MLVLLVLFLQIYSAIVNLSPKMFLVIPLIGSDIARTLGAWGLRSDRDLENLDIEEEFEMKLLKIY